MIDRSLKTVPLKLEYRTGEDDLVNDFYIPCLSQSLRYDRAVGYFTGEGLSLAARGIAELIKSGGEMRLVLGALLREEDYDQLAEGYEQRLDSSLASRLEEELSRAESEVIKQRIASLAWLVASGKLQVKVAIRVDDSGRIRRGIYHEKMGIFRDQLGNQVAFTGSSNETPGGLVDNFESDDVYKSWDDRERPRVMKKTEDFERLWNDSTPNLSVIDFTKATKEKLLKYKPETPFEKDPEDRTKDAAKSGTNGKYEPLAFQIQAIERWRDNDFKGILAMATGSGKTYTAIHAVETYVPETVLTVIVVPGKEITEQWVEEIGHEIAGARVIQCHSFAPEWSERLRGLVDYYATAQKNEIGRTFVVSIYETASSKRFLEIMRRLQPERLCVICDEVHHAGAPTTRKVLELGGRYRLGLSATPQRDWDEEGTGIILDYFGRVVYTLDIGKAIELHRLCPYEYHLHPVALEQSELASYRSISRKIYRIILILSKKHPEYVRLTAEQRMVKLLADPSARETGLETLMFKRANLLKRASGKLRILVDIMTSSPVGRCLVYCNDQAQVDQATHLLIENGMNALQYTSQMSGEARTRAMESFEEGFANIFVAIKCLDEGVDIPVCDSAVILASSKSTREFIQRRGRVLRTHKTKTKAVIHDMVVVPFIDEDQAFPLDRSEWYFIESEFKRTKLFAENALNKQEVIEEVDRLRLVLGESLSPEEKV